MIKDKLKKETNEQEDETFMYFLTLTSYWSIEQTILFSINQLLN